ncbi:peptide ABC transporter substrate-binding protein [Virgibacillus phasianinus]|uniref:peptide ABC transporter substrate-binding protein n=1 Tax=Virgibacillus phasianinus TaxID=2017483 RepID=UPI0026CBA02A
MFWGDNETSGKADSNSGESSEGSSDTEQILNLVEEDTIPTMDVSMATDEISFIYMGNTMEGLYRIGQGGKLVPGIAKEHKVSDDGLTWTFTLRDDAKWSNGDPVTAHDFVYSWQRAVDPSTGSEYGPYIMGGVIKNAKKINEGDLPADQLGVKADGDHTLIVTLEKPTPYFKSLTTFGTLFPLNEKFVEKQGKEYATNSKKLLSNGPFIIKDWKNTSTSWTLVKNPDYWDAEHVNLEKITFDVVKDAQTRVDLYEKGEIDRAMLVSDLVDKYSSRDDFTTIPQGTLSWLKFNQTRSEALANVNIRKAISKSINKQAIVDEVLNDGSIVTNGFVPEKFSVDPETGEYFREINGDLVTYDKEKAKELWKKGLEEIGKDKVELEFLGGDKPNTKVMNQYVANQMEKNLPGLTITLKQVPSKQKMELDTNMDYDIEFAGWGPDYLDPYTWLSLWLTDGGNNHMGYSNPEYDKLIQSTVDELALKPEKRFDAFLQAEKILAEDAAVAPLYQSSRALLISPKIQGVLHNQVGITYDYKWARVRGAE